MLLMLLVLAPLQSGMAHWADSVGAVHDALSYDITLIPSDTSTHVLGEVQTTWRLRSPAPVTMQLDSAMRVIRVLVDGRPNTRLSRTMYGRSEGYIAVPHQKQAGDTLSTRVRYRGFTRDGLIIGDNQYGDRTVFADNWPDRAHLWLPSHDAPGDKATVAFHVQVPDGQQAIANGVLEKTDTLPYGHTIWHYRLDSPIPVYSMVVGIGRLTRTRLPDAACAIRCVPLTVWAYPQDSAYAVGTAFRRAGEMVEYFSGLIGPFPYPSLAHVESSTRYGGMENATAIFFDQKLYRERRLEGSLVAHETAHQWFGDAVTPREWPHLWLSEGFATYMAALWRGQTAGDSALRATMARAAAAVFSSPASERPVVDTAQANLTALLNTNSYQKGAWVLHQLRGIMGDSAFFAGLRRYYGAYKDSTALSSDLARLMSEAAGQDLGWYFRQSLTQPGYPILDIKWKHGGKRLTLDISQTQKPEWGTYRIPGLELLVDGKTVRVDVEGRRSRKVVDGIARRPRELKVDPNGWWLLSTTGLVRSKT
ncbi:MAG TPA: M1 family metallopeptidase [Gemmatimonadales bacterium]|nr:M1 family metallopeptidase [Gemmatimonadales bacterium]